MDLANMSNHYPYNILFVYIFNDYNNNCHTPHPSFIRPY